MTRRRAGPGGRNGRGVDGVVISLFGVGLVVKWVRWLWGEGRRSSGSTPVTISEPPTSDRMSSAPESAPSHQYDVFPASNLPPLGQTYSPPRYEHTHTSQRLPASNPPPLSPPASESTLPVFPPQHGLPAPVGSTSVLAEPSPVRLSRCFFKSLRPGVRFPAPEGYYPP